MVSVPPHSLPQHPLPTPRTRHQTTTELAGPRHVRTTHRNWRLTLVSLAHDSLTLLLSGVLVERLAEDLLADLDDRGVIGRRVGVDSLGHSEAVVHGIRVGDALGDGGSLDARRDVKLGKVGLVREVVLELHLRGEAARRKVT
eukprot:3271650-Rhodomonas_salina.3